MPYPNNTFEYLGIYKILYSNTRLGAHIGTHVYLYKLN